MKTRFFKFISTWHIFQRKDNVLRPEVELTPRWLNHTPGFLKAWTLPALGFVRSNLCRSGVPGGLVVWMAGSGRSGDYCYYSYEFSLRFVERM